MPNVKKDTFANIAYLTATESAPNTLTFAQLAMANTLMSQRFAIIIHMVDLFWSSPANFNAPGDSFDIALTLTDRLTDIADLSQPELLFFDRFERQDIGGAPQTGMILHQPRVRDFTMLPGGGILVPADRLYIGVRSISAAAVNGGYMRLYYTVMELAEVDYWQLIEARRVMTT